MHSKFEGIVKQVRVLHKDGSETIFGEFNNLITNSGLDLLGTSAADFATARCHASTNTDAPLATDTSVLNAVAFTSTVSRAYTNSGGTPDWYYEMEAEYTFTLGSVVGNISKLYFTNSSNSVFSAVLVKDAGGNPTSQTVTADDQLFVTWALRKYVNITPVTGSIDIDFEGTPTSVTYEIKPANLGETSSQYYFHAGASAGNLTLGAYAYETQTLGAVTSVPSGSSSTIGATLAGYSSGNFYRDVTFTASTAQGNFATGVGSMAYALFGFSTLFAGYQVSFTPKLPKDNAKTFSLPFRISWGRF